MTQADVMKDRARSAGELFERDEYPGSPRILFIGLGNSSHTHSWIDLCQGARLNVRFFCTTVDLPPDDWKVRSYTVAHNQTPLDPSTRKSLWHTGKTGRFHRTMARARKRPWNEIWLMNDWLLSILRDWKPHVVHTLGVTPAQFYCGLHQSLKSSEAPKWVLQTRGGSDLQLTHLDPEQNKDIARVLRACDQLLCDNTVNFGIARDMGLREEQVSVIGTVPGTGGVDVDSFASHVTSPPFSRRTIVWPKAYESVWSKTLPVLEALKMCWERLQPCSVEMLAVDPETTSWVRTLPVNIRERCNLQPRVPRAALLRMMTSARVMLAPSLVDGVPNTMYEAMAVGALPIVSPLETIRSVVEDETNVLFARNLYPEEIAAALVRAMTDDALVDRTAVKNLGLVQRVAGRKEIRARVLAFYENLAATAESGRTELLSQRDASIDRPSEPKRQDLSRRAGFARSDPNNTKSRSALSFWNMGKSYPKIILVKLILSSFRFLSDETREAFVLYLSQLSNFSLLLLAYNEMGILKFQNAELSGERYLVDCILKKNINKTSPTFFDVGANVGEYTRDLLNAFPAAQIYAFEPNPAPFSELRNSFQDNGVECVNAGCHSESGTLPIFTYASGEHSGHASLHAKVFADLHKRTDVRQVEVRTVSLDEFCRFRGINSIDFLKIDTEGHELEVLRGAKGLLAAHKIFIIQFEFNEMNVISRVFLKDFYDLLSGYSFYRLNTTGLVPLSAYNPIHEIFQFQNLLAVSVKYPFHPAPC